MKVLCHLSGGFDSAASTLLIAEQEHEFATLLIDLGQPYSEQEQQSSRAFQDFLHGKYPQTYKGHFTRMVDMELSQEGEVSAYIPVRNLVIGAMSANLALAHGYEAIAVGNKTLELRPDDPYCFNDCSFEFYRKLGDLATFASQYKNIMYVMPLIRGGTPMTKQEVVLYIKDRGFDPSNLWSCYTNQYKPCGECHHCIELKDAGVWELVK